MTVTMANAIFCKRYRLCVAGGLDHRENIFKIDDFVKKRITYHFETTLLYEKFVFYFTDACIRFVQKYMGWLDRG